MTEHSEERPTCEKKLREIETRMDEKREKENKELLRELKTVIKEEFAALKCEVR